MNKSPARRNALKMLMTPEERQEFEALELTVQLEKKRVDYANASVQRINAEIRMVQAKHEINKLENRLRKLHGE